MKLDLEYIKNILNIMNEYENDQIIAQNLFDSINGEDINENASNKFRMHISILYEAGFINSSTPSLGILTGNRGNVVSIGGARYWPTLNGYQLLESMNNDTIWNKIKGGIQYIGVETLKQIPALAMEYLLSIGSK